MTVNHERVARALIQSGGVKFSETDPFILASRKITPIYVDVRRLTTSPRGWRQTIADLVALVREVGEEDMISGGELADLFFSIPVALQLRQPHLTIRKTTKGYGAGGRIVGQIRRGEHTVHVSDLITSGESAIEWVRAVRDAGGKVAKYVVVFDRNQGGKQALRKEKVALHSLVGLDEEFLSYSARDGALTRKGLENVRGYLREPEVWARDFLRTNPAFVLRHLEASAGRLTRTEGLEVLSFGYPELVPELEEEVRAGLRRIGVRDATLPLKGSVKSAVD